MICYPHQILFGQSNKENSERPETWYIWKRGEVHTWFLQGTRVSNYLEDLEIDRRIILR